MENFCENENLWTKELDKTSQIVCRTSYGSYGERCGVALQRRRPRAEGESLDKPQLLNLDPAGIVILQYSGYSLLLRPAKAPDFRILFAQSDIEFINSAIEGVKSDKQTVFDVIF